MTAIEKNNHDSTAWIRWENVSLRAVRVWAIYLFSSLKKIYSTNSYLGILTVAQKHLKHTRTKYTHKIDQHNIKINNQTNQPDIF